MIVQNQALYPFYVVHTPDFHDVFPYAGATKSVYALEPFDVGRFLQAEIVWNDEKVTLSTTGPIEPGGFLFFRLAILLSLVIF